MDKQPTAVVMGAGDYIGAAIARRFAAGGFHVFAARRNGDKLAPLADAIRAAGGTCTPGSTDARKEEDVAALMQAANAAGPLGVCVFNVGANVNFPVLETTERVFRKVWEMACYAGFLTGREAARQMLANGRGTILFTGATASVRGGKGYAAFASAKAGLRSVAQTFARELAPQNIHVAHLVIDSGVDTAFVRQRLQDRLGADALDKLQPGQLMQPASIADIYWWLHQQPRDAWTFELDARPSIEPW